MSAYFIFTQKVTDAEKLNNDYLPKSIKVLEAFNPEILVVDQNHEVIEGDTPMTRSVILRFESKEMAKKWYHSEAYQAIIHLRLEATEGTAILCAAFDASQVS